MSDDAPTILKARDVCFAFDGRNDFLVDVSVAARASSCLGIVGPNGAGKSTLLRLLAGLSKPTRGEVLFADAPMSKVRAAERAKRMAYLPQRVPAAPGLTAGQVVLLGRFPHRGLGLFESASDLEIARASMRTTETEGFVDRPIASLSGGEAQRVHLAAALAQEPQVLLLDEPTTALDWRHQLAIFEILRKLADGCGVAVVVVTHDLNLAARYCDNVLLMHRGRAVRSGPAAEVLTPDVLSPVFDVEVSSIPVEGGPVGMLIATERSREDALSKEAEA